MILFKRFVASVLFICMYASAVGQTDLFERVKDHYAHNDGVKIHYVTMGEGPLILFVHGFPDFWYGWRHQMKALSKNYKVAAVDMRGYNLSDHPQGAENYRYEILIKDLAAVIQNAGEQSVYLVAHDWGAAISWRFAIHHPELVKKLVIISVPHPSAGDRDTVAVENRKPNYADRFVTDEFKDQLTEYWMAGWVSDTAAKGRYLTAFRNSDKDAMLNYYKANYPTLENLKNKDFRERIGGVLPNLKMPVLIIHGKKDPYLPVKGHNNTWNYMDNELTIEILHGAGHFVQQDEPDKLTKLISEFIKK